jgi:hypothetical protein
MAGTLSFATLLMPLQCPCIRGARNTVYLLLKMLIKHSIYFASISVLLSGLENREYSWGDPFRWPCNTLCPQKLALTSPTSGGLSVGIVHLRTKATEFVLYIADHGKVPCHSTIQLWVENFRTSASILKRHHQVVRLPQDTEPVRQSFIRSPRHSTRRHSLSLGISNRSMRRILRKDINFHPYKMEMVQEFSDRDMANYSTVAEHLIGILFNSVIILMTDEAHSHLSGCVNKWNLCNCVEENPQQLHQRPLHSVHVTVQCGVVNFRFIGPCFFEDKNGCTVKSHICSLCWNVTELLHTRVESSWNWALNHMAPARASMEVIRANFPEPVISLCSKLPWSVDSPDLSASDYFLWGYLKVNVCTTRPRTIDGLKIAILKEIWAIPDNMVQQTLGNLLTRLEECVCSEEQHLSDVLFRTK